MKRLFIIVGSTFLLSVTVSTEIHEVEIHEEIDASFDNSCIYGV